MNRILRFFKRHLFFAYFSTAFAVAGIQYLIKKCIGISFYGYTPAYFYVVVGEATVIWLISTRFVNYLRKRGLNTREALGLG